jgi:hypothetical protein
VLEDPSLVEHSLLKSFSFLQDISLINPVLGGRHVFWVFVVGERPSTEEAGLFFLVLNPKSHDEVKRGGGSDWLGVHICDNVYIEKDSFIIQTLTKVDFPHYKLQIFH